MKKATRVSLRAVQIIKEGLLSYRNNSYECFIGYKHWIIAMEDL